MYKAASAAKSVVVPKPEPPKIVYMEPLPLWKLASTSCYLIRLAGLSGASAVALGAYGAHGNHTKLFILFLIYYLFPIV